MSLESKAKYAFEICQNFTKDKIESMKQQYVLLEDEQKEIYERLEWHQDLLKNKIDALGQRLERIRQLLKEFPKDCLKIYCKDGSNWIERLKVEVSGGSEIGEVKPSSGAGGVKR